MTVIRTSTDLGAAVRSRRRELGWTQAKLADLSAVGRPWLVSLESGHPRAELALALKVLRALNLGIDLVDSPEADTLDLDRHLEAYLGGGASDGR